VYTKLLSFLLIHRPHENVNEGINFIHICILEVSEYAKQHHSLIMLQCK